MGAGNLFICVGFAGVRDEKWHGRACSYILRLILWAFGRHLRFSKI